MKKFLLYVLVAFIASSCSNQFKEIRYTTTDGKIVDVKIGSINFDEDVKIISNTYQSGEGIVRFSSKITEIGECAFDGCSTLTSVTIPESVTYIGTGAFGGCSSLTSVTIPGSVTVIEDYAFARCSSLTSVTIPEGVTVIRPAFQECSSLTSVTIPESVTTLVRGAFEGCTSLKSIQGKFASSDNRCLIVDGVLDFFAPNGILEYYIPESVTCIGFGAFDGCSSLTSVTIPESVTEIDNSAFRNCSNLTSVTIGNSVTSIGNSAFGGCSSLTSVTIPDSVTWIGSRAFENCSSLTDVIVKNGGAEIMPTAFNGCVKLSSLMIGEEYAAFDGIAWHRQYDFNDIDDLKRYLKRMSDEIFYNSGDFGSMRLRLDDNGDPSTLYHSDGAIYDVCRWSVKNNNIGLLVMDRDLRLLHSVVMSKSGMLTIKIAGEIRFEPRKMI